LEEQITIRHGGENPQKQTGETGLVGSSGTDAVREQKARSESTPTKLDSSVRIPAAQGH
jgi:hypothetical protein